MPEETLDIDTLARLRGLNATGLARAAGLSRAALWQIRRGKRRSIKLSTARAWANALGVDLETIEAAVSKSREFGAAERERRATLTEILGPRPVRPRPRGEDGRFAGRER